jgi:chemotaxis protein MotB
VSRRRRTRDHANHERWLVSYADFITLLFAFFVVLYSSAQVDQRKVGKLSLAIQVAFQELGVFPASTTQIPLDANEPMPFSNVQVIQNVQRTTELGRVSPSPKGSPDSASEQTDLTSLRDELQLALRHEIDVRAVALHQETEGLVISLREFGFFDSGSTQLKPSALPTLDHIASILAARKCRVRIEGHTDNIPIHNVHVASNWELSTARATELVRFLIQRYDFAPDHLSAAGYAEFHPISTNLTPQGRAQNRRVDVVILTERAIRMTSPEPAVALAPPPAPSDPSTPHDPARSTPR